VITAGEASSTPNKLHARRDEAPDRSGEEFGDAPCKVRSWPACCKIAIGSGPIHVVSSGASTPAIKVVGGIIRVQKVLRSRARPLRLSVHLRFRRLPQISPSSGLTAPLQTVRFPRQCYNVVSIIRAEDPGRLRGPPIAHPGVESTYRDGRRGHFSGRWPAGNRSVQAGRILPYPTRRGPRPFCAAKSQSSKEPRYIHVDKGQPVASARRRKRAFAYGVGAKVSSSIATAWSRVPRPPFCGLCIGRHRHPKSGSERQKRR